MTEVVVSTKYQVVIPREIRKKIHLLRGQKMSVATKGNIIIFMPAIPLKAFRGMTKDMDTTHIREKKDRE